MSSNKDSSVVMWFNNLFPVAPPTQIAVAKTLLWAPLGSETQPGFLVKMVSHCVDKGFDQSDQPTGNKAAGEQICNSKCDCEMNDCEGKCLQHSTPGAGRLRPPYIIAWPLCRGSRRV